MFQRLKGQESGQSIIIIAFAMVAIIGMVALVLDGGYAYLDRRRVQNAADSSALAGARGLREDMTRATIGISITEYARLNGITSPSTNVRAYFVDASNNIIDSAYPVGSGAVSANATGIVVQATEQHATFFARVIGYPTITVRAVAQASVEATGAWSGCAPIALLTTEFTPTLEYTIWDGFKSGSVGDRGWIRFTGYSGSDDLRWLMENGYPGTINVFDWLHGDPGVKNGVFQNANTWVGRTYIIPIYDDYNDHDKTYHIIAFAAFKVESWLKSGNDSAIVGSFTKYEVNSVSGGALGYGVGTVRLKPPATIP